MVTLCRIYLKIKKFYIFPTQTLCHFLWISEQEATLSQYNIKLWDLGPRLGVFTARYVLNISIQCRLMLVLTPWRSRFNPSSVHVKFVVDRAAPGQDLPRVPWFSLVIITQTLFHIHQSPAGLPASFPCKLNTFRKRVKNVVTSKGIEVGVECK